ncbi:hypothetical protein CIFRMM205B2_24445 [Citrobacter freundii]
MNFPFISKPCFSRFEKWRNDIRDELEWQPSDEDVSRLSRCKTFFMGFW